MHNAWLAALVFFCLLTGGWILVQAGEGRGDSGFAAGLAEQAEAALADANASEPGRFYRYTDDSGSMHFVSSLAEVPKHLRDKARAVTNDRVQRAPPGPAPVQRMRTARAEPARAERAIDKEVVVYTTSWCGWCRKTLAFLTEQGVAFENRDIEANEMWRDELEEKTGSTSIPVVEIDGEIIRGYNPTRMQELLEAS